MPTKIKTTTELENPSFDKERLTIQRAKDDFESANNHWNMFREKSSDCLNYLESDYLRSDYMANREASGMPALTENRIPAFHETIVSQLRQNMPAIQIDSASQQTDPQFAEQLGDSIRTIEQDSNASLAYSEAAWYAVGTGLGYARVMNEYVNDDSMEQKMVIRPIEDPSTVYMDPNSKCLVGSDANFFLIVADIPYNDYLRKYGTNTQLGTLIQQGQIHGFDIETMKRSNGWIQEKSVRIAEYYVKEWFKKKIYQVWDSSIGALKVVDELPEGADERDSREVKYCVIKHYVLNDLEILEENFWPGKYIPIVACKGIEFWNMGKRHLKGMIDDMRDPQRRLDFIINWQADMMMLAPKAPYVGTATMFEDNQDDWANINLSNIAYITYKPDPMAPNVKPERDIADVQLNSSQQFYVNAVEGLKAVTGMQAPLVNTTLGEAPPTTESGIALQTRIRQSHDSTFHFQDHIRHFIAHIGQIIVDAFPTFYGENGRQIMATKANGEQYIAEFNTSDRNMLESAKFKVRVETGPAYATKAQEDMDRGFELMRTDPQVAPLVMDLIAGKGQGQFWKLVAARLRAAVPPQILAATEDMDQQEAPQMVANLKGQVASLTQQVQKLTAETMPDKEKIQELQMKLIMEKNDNTYDLEKTKLEHTREQDKVKFEKEKLRIEEQKIILEAEIKRKELELEAREIAIKEAEFKLKTTVAASNIASDMMEHHHKVQGTMIDIKGSDVDNTSQESKSGADGDMNDLSMEK
jgi:hypothetical protein